MDRLTIFIAVALVLAVLMVVFLSVSIYNLYSAVNELKLRHDQLEDGFADFMDEYYQTEQLWPVDMMYIG